MGVDAVTRVGRSVKEAKSRCKAKRHIKPKQPRVSLSKKWEKAIFRKNKQPIPPPRIRPL